MVKSHFFPYFNSFRFFAAALVFIQHCEEALHIFGITNFSQKFFIKDLGAIGVTLFFTLSGFLITYVLLRKSANEGLKTFYTNRFLRIWPLYFLTLLIYKVIVPNLDDGFISFMTPQNLGGNFASIIFISPALEWFLLLIFLPQVLLALGHVFNPVFVWSIGVEEIFYLIWPKFILSEGNKAKRIFQLLISYLVFYFISFTIWLLALKEDLEITSSIFQFSTAFLYMQRVSCMCIGGYFAIKFVSNENFRFEKWSIPLFSICHLVILGIIGMGLYTPILINEIISLCFGYIMFCIAAQKNSYSNKSVKFSFLALTEQLGKYSYGIYMFHTVALYISISLLTHLNYHSRSTVYLVSSFLTIFFSFLSFEFYEKKFLALKRNKS